MATYWERQLGRVDSSAAIKVHMKITGFTGETNYLSLTHEQFEALKAFMLSIEEDGEL